MEAEKKAKVIFNPTTQRQLQLKHGSIGFSFFFFFRLFFKHTNTSKLGVKILFCNPLFPLTMNHGRFYSSLFFNNIFNGCLGFHYLNLLQLILAIPCGYQIAFAVKTYYERTLRAVKLFHIML